MNIKKAIATLIAVVLLVGVSYYLGSRQEKVIAPLTAGDPWVAFNQELSKAAAYIHRDETPKDPLTIAEGYRFLARMLRLSWEHTYEYADPNNPKLFKVNEDYMSNGINTTDCLYLTAIIDGHIDYKLSGLRGTAPLIEISTYEGLYGTVKNSVRVDFITEQDLQLEPDGSFSLILSQTPQAKGWLKTSDKTTVLFVRQYTHDWSNTQAAELVVEPLQTLAARPTTLVSVTDGYANAAHFLNNYLDIFTGLADRGKSLKENNLIPIPTMMQASLPGGHRYAAGSFNLQADDIMLLSFKPVTAPYWGVQLGNYWSEVLDYEGSGSHLNNQTAVLDNDGRVTIAISQAPRPREPPTGWTLVTILQARLFIVSCAIWRARQNLPSN
ncbi:DUF1214 domain-containing protein [Oceanicoccus sp. KOV_DT_Chl]|uniref:DUF1214 domain-containing protein n=1 Tax=Oceanicoccus sp. KOV_DT_Chl TaxID=1904639 RepID=UPI000C79D080|nr:DUF1214 domain-containing protein [Oceanicoccus sp. KOV_DT_Chl]